MRRQKRLGKKKGIRHTTTEKGRGPPFGCVVSVRSLETTTT